MGDASSVHRSLFGDLSRPVIICQWACLSVLISHLLFITVSCKRKAKPGRCTSPRDEEKAKVGERRAERRRDKRRRGTFSDNNKWEKEKRNPRFLERYLNCRESGHCVPNEKRSGQGCRPSCGLQPATWHFNNHCFRVHPFLNKIWLYSIWTQTGQLTVGTGCSCCSGFTPIEEPTWAQPHKAACCCIVKLFVFSYMRVSGSLLHVSMFCWVCKPQEKSDLCPTKWYDTK